MRNELANAHLSGSVYKFSAQGPSFDFTHMLDIWAHVHGYKRTVNSSKLAVDLLGIYHYIHPYRSGNLIWRRCQSRKIAADKTASGLVIVKHKMSVECTMQAIVLGGCRG